jgi:hypothetical protein
MDELRTQDGQVLTESMVRENLSRFREQERTGGAIAIDELGGDTRVPTLPRMDERPVAGVSQALTTPPPQPVRQSAEEGVRALMARDTGAEIQSERERVGVEAKEERARKLNEQLVARQRDMQRQIEAVEQNTRGKTEFALNAELNKLQREQARELADLSFSYQVALGDYQAAEQIVAQREQQISQERVFEMQAWQTLFNFAQNDMTESEKLQAQQAFAVKQADTDFQRQQELMNMQSQLRTREQEHSFNLKVKADNAQNAFISDIFGFGTPTGQSAISFEDYLAMAEESAQMSFTSETIQQLRGEYEAQMQAFTGDDQMAKINQAVMMGIITPQQASFAIDNLDITTPKDRQRQAQVVETGRGVLRDIDRALELVGSASVGIRSVAGQQFAGTDNILWAFATRPFTSASKVELAQHLESVKSNLSIEELQRMRENSPTGGALGQVPVKQQEYLMSMKGSLKVNMPSDALQGNLQDLYNIYLDAMFGSPEELSSAVRRGRLSAQQANSYLQARKESSYNEFHLPFASSGGQLIDNLKIAPDGTLINIQ